MEKLQKTSARMQALALIFLFLTPFTVVLTAMTGQWYDLLNLPHHIPLAVEKITGAELWVVMGIGYIKPIAYMVSFVFLYKLMGLYRQGIVFSAATVTAIRKIGWALVAIDIAGVVQTVSVGPVLSYFELTPGHITISLEAGFLIVGLFVVLVSYVMDIGRELKEQDSLVI